MIQEPAYYANIPAPVRYDRTLPAAAKLMYGEITALTTKEGYCWAGNAYFAQLYDVSKDTVSVWINKLDKCGYVRVVIDHKAGNTRRIYLSDKNAIPIAKKQDRYSEKTVELSRKTPKAIAKNREHSITSNNTESITNKEEGGAVPAPMAETVGINEPITVEAEERKQKAPFVPAVSPAKTELAYPPDWPADLVAFYRDEWIPFRQSKPGASKLLPKSIQAQINSLALLSPDQARACINNSLSNGYTGLIYDRFTSQTTANNGNHRPANNRVNNPANSREFGKELDALINARYGPGPGQPITDGGYAVVVDDSGGGQF